MRMWGASGAHGVGKWGVTWGEAWGASKGDSMGCPWLDVGVQGSESGARVGQEWGRSGAAG